MNLTETLKRKMTDNQGMTLVEVIVSMALLGILAAMLITILTTSLLLSIRSGDNTRATVSAGAQMSVVLLTPPTGEPAATAVVTFHGSDATTLSSDPIDGSFVTRDEIVNQGDAAMKSFVIED